MKYLFNKINPNDRVRDLIRGRLKKSSSYFTELENKTLKELTEISSANSESKNKAVKMPKLIKQSNRLMGKH